MVGTQVHLLDEEETAMAANVLVEVAGQQKQYMVRVAKYHLHQMRTSSVERKEK
jgi:hypothetical protein